MFGGKIRSMFLILAVVFAAGPIAASEKSEKLFEEGLTVLAGGDFDGAFRAFVTAAKADPETPRYKQHAALVKRVKQIRVTLEKETDPKKWWTGALSLRSFYYDYSIKTEALLLDQEAHRRLRTVTTATNLAESRLESGIDAEAIDILSRIPAEQRLSRTRTLLAIGLARQGKRDEALASVSVINGEKADAKILLDLARIAGCIDEIDRAGILLTRAFEKTPPSRLAVAKSYASLCPDLAKLRGSEQAEAVWATASKVTESECSSGSDCSTCPSRGDCGDE